MKERKTLKQVRELVAALPEEVNGFGRTAKAIECLTDEECRYMNEAHLIGTSDYKHLVYVNFDFDDEDCGILQAVCYTQEAVEKFAKESARVLFDEYGGEWTAEYCEWHEEHFPEPFMTFDVPLERGYSDTPKRTDTTFSSLDLEYAVTEALDNHYQCGKCRPWMLRGLINADELGLSEEEFERELEEFCA